MTQLTEATLPTTAIQENVPDKIGIDILDSFVEQVEKIPFDKIECKGRGKSIYYIHSIDHLSKTAKEHCWDIGIKNEAPHIFNGCFWEHIEWKTFQHFLQAVGMRQGIP